MTERKPWLENLVVAGVAVIALAAFLLLHFRNPEIFHRALIDYDDQTYIAPIRALSFADYFGTWMRNPENFAFPLRDLTFFFDFAIEKKTGLTPFWVTNAVLFLGTFVVFYRMFREALGHARGFALALILWILFHPALVEMVQWASNRKHLLVGLFLSVASVRVLRLARAQEYPSEKEWMVFFITYIAAWLCWPSASLWIFAVLFIFRRKMAFDSRAGLRITAALVMGVGAIAWTFLSHQTFSGSAANTVGSAGIQRIPIFGLASIGRGIFSFFWPYTPNFAGQEPYYRLEHPAGFIGLGILFTISIFSIWRYRSLDVTSRQPARDALVLAAALFVPQAMTFLTYVEFVWADRYLYLAAPYLTLGLTLLIFPPTTLVPRNKTKKVDLVAAAPLRSDWRWLILSSIGIWTLASALVAAQLTPRWSSSLKLFTDCYHTERSPRCLILAANQTFDRTGCMELSLPFSIARDLSSHGKLPFEFMFRTQFPLYESICIARSDLLPLAKRQAFAELYTAYESPQYAVFGEVLATLREGDLPGAMNQAYASYLGPNFAFADLFPKAGNLLRAQANALCELTNLAEKKKKTPTDADFCRQRTAILEQLTANATPDPSQYQWGFQRTVEAFNEGKTAKIAKGTKRSRISK